MSRELGIEKVRVNLEIRARKFQEKIRDMEENRCVKVCWNEKMENGWEGLYVKEREKFNSRNGWGVAAIDNMAKEERNLINEIRNREWDIKMQLEDSKIRQARYNVQYKDRGAITSIPKYLRNNDILGNMEERKYAEIWRRIIISTG